MISTALIRLEIRHWNPLDWARRPRFLIKMSTLWDWVRAAFSWIGICLELLKTLTFVESTGVLAAVFYSMNYCLSEYIQIPRADSPYVRCTVVIRSNDGSLNSYHPSTGTRGTKNNPELPRNFWVPSVNGERTNTLCLISYVTTSG